MPNKILIVESDSTLSQSLRSELEGRGFTVEETRDGKASQELIRKQRPDLVVLAVELSAGQNGYILCGKLKKDDELKATPVIIIGNPDGFAQHRKLKTRADDYLANPLSPPDLAEKVGALIGFPEAPAGELVDDSLSLSDLVDEEPEALHTNEYQAEEISIEAPVESTLSGDPELDHLDAAFDDISSAPPAELPPPPPSAGPSEDVELSSFSADEDSPPLTAGEDESYERTTISTPDLAAALAPVLPPSPVAASRGSSSASPAESRELRAQVAQLQGALDDANARAAEHQSRIDALEAELAAQHTEVETARSSGSKDKEFFALREANTKKDKEILRLKSELHEKEKEVVDANERENSLEQQVSESSGSIARRDAQIKTLTAKADQLASERKKIDQQLLAARDEGRTATANLASTQAELDQMQERLNAVEAETASLRDQHSGVGSKLQEAVDEAEQLRQSHLELKSRIETAESEADQHRSLAESAQMDLDSAKGQLTHQATAFAEEAASLRKRISEFEETSSKSEERLTRLYARIKAEEKIREKTKKALSIALQLLDEQVTGGDGDSDEEAAA